MHTNDYVSDLGSLLTLFTILEPNIRHDYSIELLMHGLNTATIAVNIGRCVGVVNQEDRVRLFMNSLVHDIGKSLIPSDIIYKSGKLDAQEMKIMQLHPLYSEDIFLKFSQHDAFASSLETLTADSEAIRYHHERWDGKGYPFGISGEDIPFMSRIISIADAFDAMVSKRVYSSGVCKNPVDEIARNSGTQFDPNIVAASKKELEAIYSRISNNRKVAKELMYVNDVLANRQILIEKAGINYSKPFDSPVESVGECDVSQRESLCKKENGA